jgi:hypothetical protein
MQKPTKQLGQQIMNSISARTFSTTPLMLSRKQRWDNTTLSLCTDQADDDFQELAGEVMPMDLVDVEVGDGKTVNFQVYVFDTGKFLRHGKWERDAWWYYGQSNVFYDVAMHVHFEQAQPKLNPDQCVKGILTLLKLLK